MLSGLQLLQVYLCTLSLEIVTKWHLIFSSNTKYLIPINFVSFKNQLKEFLELFLNFLMVYGEFSWIIF